MTGGKNLTLRYSLQQMAYWAMYAGPVSFAAAYLLEKGFHASQVGIVLACANFFSCLLQPVLANFADRARGAVLPRMLALLAALSFACFGAILLFSPPMVLFALFYLVGVLAFDAMVPLMNSVSVYYTLRGRPINYGVGRGVGSLAFSAAALGIGYLIELAGADWMPRMELVLLALFAVITLGYPKVEEAAVEREKTALPQQDTCSLGAFFLKYKWYNLSLLGVLFLAMFHAMTENYLIEIMRRLGGGSGSVGAALFVATLAEVPVLFFFGRIHARLSSNFILIASGVMFTVKAVLFLLAGSVLEIYLIEILQVVTYAFLSPVQMYYAKERVAPGDMVKGQSMATASYALGCASGNLIGGQLVGFFSVPVMLAAGVVMAAVGTAILILTVGRKDCCMEIHT